MRPAPAPTSYTRDLAVLSGPAVQAILEGREREVLGLVDEAYALHATGRSANPDSLFLRFPETPNARIIALPAYLGGSIERAGLKWIASFPDNVRYNLQRASAVMVLNDCRTGYPLALIEASQISAHRTGAMAALAARALSTGVALSGRYAALAVVGCGVIARHILRYLAAAGICAERTALYDLAPENAERLAAFAAALPFGHTRVSATLAGALDGAGLIVLATTAPEPYVHDVTLFKHTPLVLNVSLRDISPHIVLGSQNILDDVEHCLKACTSPHLAEMLVGDRDFVAGTLHDVQAGRVSPDPRRTRIFSPFGLGVLDVALASRCLEHARAAGTMNTIENFLPEMNRW